MRIHSLEEEDVHERLLSQGKVRSIYRLDACCESQKRETCTGQRGQEKVGIRHNKKREEKKGREKENRETYRASQLASLPPRPSSLNAKQAFCFGVFVEALFSFMNMRVRFFSICTFGQCNMSDQKEENKDT